MIQLLQEEDKLSFDDSNIIFFSQICKALSHPARILIIKHLKAIDQCICGKIVDMLPLAQSTVSQHLKCLKEADLIKGAVEGQRICYCLNNDVLERFKKMVNIL